LRRVNFIWNKFAVAQGRIVCWQTYCMSDGVDEAPMFAYDNQQTLWSRNTGLWLARRFTLR